MTPETDPNLFEGAAYHIPFRQYHLPDGRQTEEEFPHNDAELDTMAQAIIQRGYRFEAEVLSTGQVSVTCHDIEDEVDIAIEICSNGPAIAEAIDKLVKAAHVIAVGDDAEKSKFED